jgi:hypothetical protein
MPVDPQRLVFTSQQTTGTFTLTNLTERRLPFTIRKTEHTIQRDSGHEQITEDPLHWLQMASETEGFDTHASLTVVLEPGASTALRFAEPVAPDFPKWAGVLTVTAPGTADVPVHVGYLDSPAGQWTGTAYYLANFGTGQLAPWVSAVATDDEASAGAAVALVGNALIRRWWAFRRGSLSRDEFDAVLMAVTEESWKWPVSRAFCGNDNAACYPSDNLVGFSVLSDDIEASPVPSGLSQLDISLNLQPGGDDPRTWLGRVDSAHTLQYPGNPGITMKFANDPSDCHFAGERDACLTVLSELRAETVIGGRYPATADDRTCAQAGDARFEPVEVPWLVPGFDRDTALTPDGSGARSRFECRDGHLPLGGAEDLRALNLSLTAANPVPDGATLRSRLELLDGALINGEELFVLFRETLPELLPGQGPTQAYGFMIFRRSEAALLAADYVGFEPPADPEPPMLPGPTCADWLVETVIDDGGASAAIQALGDGALSQGHIRRLALGALEGTARELAPPTIDANDPERPHYVCHDIGYIDQGGARGYACPPGSLVSFFTVRRVEDDAGNWVDPVAFTRACDAEQGQCRPGEPCAATEQVFTCYGETCQRMGGCDTALGAQCNIKWKPGNEPNDFG